MRHFIPLLAALAFIWGCSEGENGVVDESDDDSSKTDTWGDEVEQDQEAHRTTVLACEATSEQTLEQAGSTVEMVSSLAQYHDCVFEANNDARPVIEQNLADIESDLYGTTNQTFADWRDINADLCDLVVDWSDGATGTMSQLVRGDCLGQRERALADLIDSLVMFPDGAEPLATNEDRQNHGACYEVMDQELDAATSNQDMQIALYDAAECVKEDLYAQVPDLVQMTIDNYPESEATDTEAAIRDGLDKALSINGDACTLLAQASDSGGGTMANLYTAGCIRDAAEMLYRQAVLGAD